MPNEPTVSNDESRVALLEGAHEYVRQLRAFYMHAAVAGINLLIILVVNLATNVAAGVAGEWSAWWSAWAVLGWGAGIAVHGLVVRLARPKAETSTWEQEQVDKVLAR